MAKTMSELFRLFGDLPADKAHAEMKNDPSIREIPSRTDIRDGWRQIKEDGVTVFVGVFETECGRRFLSRQGRWRFCNRTGAVALRVRDIEQS